MTVTVSATLYNIFTDSDLQAMKSIAETESARLVAAGHIVPDIDICWINLPVRGLAGYNKILVHPDTNMADFRFAVMHEIGHHNEPIRPFNLWDDEPDFEAKVQRSEDFANWFAVNS